MPGCRWRLQFPRSTLIFRTTRPQTTRSSLPLCDDGELNIADAPRPTPNMPLACRVLFSVNKMLRFLSFRLKLALFMLALGGLFTGARGVYTAATNHTPTVVSYEQCLKSRPEARWLRVTNGELDVLHTCWLTRRGGDKSLEQSTTYYVPLREPNSFDGQVCILVKTTDPAIKQVLTEGNAATSQSDAVAKAWVLKNLKRIYRREDVEGVVTSSWDLESTVRAALAKAEVNLPDDYLVLDVDQRPSFVLSGVSLVTGLALLGLVGVTVLPKREEERPVKKAPPPVPKVYTPPTHCRMCQTPVVVQGTEAPKTCEQCGADLTRR